MKIEKLTLSAASDRTAYDIADMIDIRYHLSVAKVRVFDDLHGEISASDDWLEIVKIDIEAFCPDAIFEKVDRWQEN